MYLLRENKETFDVCQNFLKYSSFNSTKSVTYGEFLGKTVIYVKTFLTFFCETQKTLSLQENLTKLFYASKLSSN